MNVTVVEACCDRTPEANCGAEQILQRSIVDLSESGDRAQGSALDNTRQNAEEAEAEEADEAEEAEEAEQLHH